MTSQSAFHPDVIMSDRSTHDPKLSGTLRRVGERAPWHPKDTADGRATNRGTD